MLIQVKLKNDRYDYVKDFMIGDLIEAGAISGFQRRSGWVTIGVDPVRSNDLNRNYRDKEKRRTTKGKGNFPVNRNS
jgi:hypothetical protein